MLRPGEYAHTKSKEATPFCFKHVHLFIGRRRINHFMAPLHQLSAATSVALEFDKQKNGVRGELITLSRSGHQTICPVAAVVARVIHLKQHHATQDTPLYSFWHIASWDTVVSKDLTYALRTATLSLGPQEADSMSARSLRSAGAMALFCAGMNNTTIQLLGRSTEISPRPSLPGDSTMRSAHAATRGLCHDSKPTPASITILPACPVPRHA
jgi:hypothetical protein